jgi:chromosome partitioning protein
MGLQHREIRGKRGERLKTIALSSFKGGTGKSSLTVLLGNTYAAAGKRVLIIDLDHQRNTTQYHTTDQEAILTRNIAEAFHRGTLEGNILPSHIVNVDLVAGSFGILQQRAAGLRTLERLLEPVKDHYDVAIIDCHPTLDNIVLNAWLAADRILTPARLDSFDLDGVEDLSFSIERETPEKVSGWSIVLNFYKPPRTNNPDNLALQLEDVFTQRYPHLLPVRIPDTVAIFKAVHEGDTITTAQRSAKVYEAITTLAGELLGEEIEPVGGVI